MLERIKLVGLCQMYDGSEEEFQIIVNMFINLPGLGTLYTDYTNIIVDNLEPDVAPHTVRMWAHGDCSPIASRRLEVVKLITEMLML